MNEPLLARLDIIKSTQYQNYVIKGLPKKAYQPNGEVCVWVGGWYGQSETKIDFHLPSFPRKRARRHFLHVMLPTKPRDKREEGYNWEVRFSTPVAKKLLLLVGKWAPWNIFLSNMLQRRMLNGRSAFNPARSNLLNIRFFSWKIECFLLTIIFFPFCFCVIFIL